MDKDLEFHKKQLAKILEADAKGEAKYLSREEFEAEQEKFFEELRKKYQKQASGQ